MKKSFVLFVLFSLVCLVLVSCANTEEGYQPDAGYIPEEETVSPLFSSESSVILTSEEENEIVLAYANRIDDTEPNAGEYTVLCYGVSETEEYGRVYAVIVRSPQYVSIGFDEYFESPFDYPVTREYRSDSYDVWSDMRAPLLLYKDGEFYPWKSDIVSSEFIREVLDTYKIYNEKFYSAMGSWKPAIDSTAP